MNTNVIDMNRSTSITWNRVCTQKDFTSEKAHRPSTSTRIKLIINFGTSAGSTSVTVITMTLERQRFSAPQSPRPNLLSLTGKPTRTTREARKAHSYYLNRLMHIPFDPTQDFHSLRSRKITFVSKEKELRAQKGWRAANVSPIKPLRLTAINGIFLLSHSIRFSFSPHRSRSILQKAFQ